MKLNPFSHQPAIMPKNSLQLLAKTVPLLIFLMFNGPMSSARHENIPERVYPGTTKPWRLPYPVDRPMPPGYPITPPGEDQFFPVRKDGQVFLLNIPIEANLTDRINRFYFDPKWRGEVWTPFDQFTLIERQSHAMGTWPEYNEFSELRKFNWFHYFMERWTGYGP